MILRDYQQRALEAITADLDNPGASIVVAPTGSGKSHIIAAAALLKRPVLILVPSRELLRQNYDKLALVTSEDEIGIYSASFNSRDIKTFTIATIQSVYKRPELFRHIQLVIIDECHQVNPGALSSMYASFLREIGTPKVIGFTASPVRLEIVYERVVKWVDGKKETQLFASTGVKMINRMRSKKTKENPKREIFWKRIIFNQGYQGLLKDGFLCPLEYIHEPLVPYESVPVNVSHSDFNLMSYSQMVIGMEANILRTISVSQHRYKSVLVFCADTSQAMRLQEIVKNSELVLGTTPNKERAQIINDFKNGAVQTVFNVGCLTTGFDHPSLDCIILLRPVRSPILYQQMLGRLTRPSPGKSHGTVIDLTGSCKSLGSIESFEVFLNNGLWDLRSERVDSFHGKLLFKMKIDA